MPYQLPELPYAYDALEPHYDEATVRLHHDIHHKGYVDGLNNAEAKLAEAREKGDFGLVKHWERELAFHGSGHLLHTLFWTNMTPDGGGTPAGSLGERISQDFGSFEAFKKQFSAAAVAVEGSGWAVLVWNPEFKKLEILQAEKHQNLTQWGAVPLLTVDVWEHAYYLDYQSKRRDYALSWWQIVNWCEVELRLAQALKCNLIQ